MRTLFYVEPLVERENPSWKTGWLTHFVQNMSSALLAEGATSDEIACIAPTSLGETARLVLPKCRLATIDQTELIPRFGSCALEVATGWYKGIYSKSALQEMASLVQAKLGDYVPEYCITFSPAPFLQHAFPSAKLFHFELGFISRPPYPETVYLDPIGMFESGALACFSTKIKAYSPTDIELRLIEQIRSSFSPGVHCNNPVHEFVHEPLSSYKAAILLSMQFSNFYAYDAHAQFNEQYDLLINTLENTPKNIAVVVCEHPEHPVLRDETIKYLRQRYTNFVWHPIFRVIYAVSHYLMPYVQGVVTVSSSVGLQALLWKKPLAVIGHSQLDIVCDAHSIDELLSKLNGPWPSEKEAVLVWLLTRFHLPFRLLCSSGRFTRYMQLASTDEFSKLSCVAESIGLGAGTLIGDYQKSFIEMPASAFANGSAGNSDNFFSALYFASGSHTYDEKSCIRRFVSWDLKSQVTLEFPLANLSNALLSLRFDPTSVSGYVDLAELWLADGSGKRIWIWNGTKATLGNLHQICAIAKPDGKGMLLQCWSDDPQIELKIDATCLENVAFPISLWVTLGKVADKTIYDAEAVRVSETEVYRRTVAERNVQIEGLNLTNAGHHEEIGNLTEAVSARDGQIATLNQIVAEREVQIENLKLTVAERDGQIENLKQSVAERDGKNENINHAISEYEGRIIAYHNVATGRDETIRALSDQVAERDRIILETYRSHSWRLTKPIRFLSRSVRRALNLGQKFKPSKIKFVYNLAKPHLKSVIHNPGRLKSKLHFFNIAWQSGGYRGVIRHLQRSNASNPAVIEPSNVISIIEVMQHLSRIPHSLKPPDSLYRVAEAALGYRRDSHPVVLFISHTYGGGTEKHIIELADALVANNVRVLLLRPFNGENGCDVTLEAFKSETLKVELTSQNIDLLASVIKAFAVSKVHVHHTIGFGFSVEELLIAIGLPYDVTIHDYYSICPLINLRSANKGYCGLPTTDDCNACLALEPARASGIEITWWRAKYASLLNGASAVYCPSHDTAKRIAEHYPAAPLQVVLHEEINLPSVRYAKEARTSRRIAILGVLASHKGLSLIEDALALIEKNELPIEFALIGYPERAISGSKAYTQTGPYTDSELPAIIEKIDPDAILFPAQWPETYSYTLTTAILSGRPIVVANLGSLPERIKDISNAFVYPYEYTAVELVEYLLTLHIGQVGSVQNRGAVSHG